MNRSADLREAAYNTSESKPCRRGRRPRIDREEFDESKDEEKNNTRPIRSENVRNFWSDFCG